MPLINTITKFLTRLTNMPEEKVKKPRLGQAATEFNVSMDRIIDILTKNGLEISSPTLNSKLTEEMYLCLQKELAKDKMVKEKSDQILTPKTKKEETKTVMDDFMKLFADFGKIVGRDPKSKEAQEMVQRLRDYISAHFYNCTTDILSGLGKMYASGNEFTENIDKAGGKGTAEFVSKAVEEYCK